MAPLQVPRVTVLSVVLSPGSATATAQPWRPRGSQISEVLVPPMGPEENTQQAGASLGSGLHGPPASQTWVTWEPFPFAPLKMGPGHLVTVL